jgi:hypothetical protein
VSAPIHTTLKFSGANELKGFPVLEATLAPLHCSNDGVTYLDGYRSVATQSTSELYSVSEEGDTQRIARALPSGYGRVLVKDFFAGDRSLISLLEASGGKSASGDPKKISFFLSLSDRDGGHPSLVELNIPFQPYKVAILGLGEILVLGLDTSNGVPLLAMIRDDGTVDRFVDLDNGDF